MVSYVIVAHKNDDNGKFYWNRKVKYYLIDIQGNSRYLPNSTAYRFDNFINNVPQMRKIQTEKGVPLREEEKQLPLIKDLIDRFTFILLLDIQELEI
jgi:hypothetical protein